MLVEHGSTTQVNSSIITKTMKNKPKNQNSTNYYILFHLVMAEKGLDNF
jgi:hypothetical protein